MPADNPQPLLSEPWAKHFEKGGGSKKPFLADGTIVEMYRIPRGRVQVFLGMCRGWLEFVGDGSQVHIGWESSMEVSS